MDQLVVKILEFKEGHQVFQLLFLQAVEEVMELEVPLIQQHLQMVDQVEELVP